MVNANHAMRVMTPAFILKRRYQDQDWVWLGAPYQPPNTVTARFDQYETAYPLYGANRLGYHSIYE